MSALVIDCSVAAAWCFADEGGPAVLQLLQRVRAEGGVVPAVWFAEIGNVLLAAERRGRVASADVSEYLALLGALDMDVDADSGPRVHRVVVPLARRHGLTAYDAVYLELAMRRGLPLATLDHELARAAAAERVQVLPG